jgi:hypothetical protein
MAAPIATDYAIPSVEVIAEQFTRDLAPADSIERSLVHQLARAQWKLLHLERREDQLYPEPAAPIDELGRIERIAASARGAYTDCLRQLRLQQSRRSQADRKQLDETLDQMLAESVDALPDDGLAALCADVLARIERTLIPESAGVSEASAEAAASGP